jgi:WD40 repeat protein
LAWLSCRWDRLRAGGSCWRLALNLDCLAAPPSAGVNLAAARIEANAEASPPARLPEANAGVSPPLPAAELNSIQSDVLVAVNIGQSAIMRKLRIAPNGKLIAISGDDGIIRIVRLDTFEVIKVIPAHADRVSDLDFTPDSKILLSAGRDGYLRFWDAASGQKAKADLHVDASVPYSARLNPQFPNRFVLMGDKDGRLFAWDLIRNRRIVSNAKFHDGPVLRVAYQPKGNGTYLSAGGDGLLKIRLPDGKRYTVHAHAGPIFDAGYNLSGSMVYSAGRDRKIKVWDPNKLAQGHPDAIFEGHLKYVIAATISSDGKLLASGGGDKAINLWSIQKRALAGRLIGHTSDIEALAFTPDNRFLISASEDKSIRIWSVEDGKELVRMFFNSNGETYAGVTFDNRSFGNRDSGLFSVFVNGRAVGDQEAARSVKYIGRGITILDSGRAWD